MTIDDMFSNMLLDQIKNDEEREITYDNFCKFIWQSLKVAEEKIAKLCNNITREPTYKISQSQFESIFASLIIKYPQSTVKNKSNDDSNTLHFSDLVLSRNFLLNLLAAEFDIYIDSDAQFSTWNFESQLPKPHELIYDFESIKLCLLSDLKAILLKELFDKLTKSFKLIQFETDLTVLTDELANLKSTIIFVCYSRSPYQYQMQSIIVLQLFTLFLQHNLLEKLYSLMMECCVDEITPFVKKIRSDSIDLFTIFFSFFQFETNHVTYQSILANFGIDSNVFTSLTSLVFAECIKVFLAEFDFSALNCLVSIAMYSK